MSDTRSEEEKLSQAAVERLVMASAPEQEQMIRELWGRYCQRFRLVDDRPGATLDAGAYGIVRFSHRTMLTFWLLSFATWKAFHAFGTILLAMRRPTGAIALTSDDLDIAPGQAEAEREYAQAIAEVRILHMAGRVEDFTWPEGVPQPHPGFTPASDTERAAFELCAIATGFAFLHESHHVTLSSQGNATVTAVDEELDCDHFARVTLLANIDRYSKLSGYPADAVLEKRALGAALNAYFVLVLTPVDLWHGSVSHPAVGRRFRHLTDELADIDPDSMFWLLLAAMLLAHLRLEGRPPKSVTVGTFRELCYTLFTLIDSQGIGKL